MGQQTDARKLAELRAKTDRQLVNFIDRRLDHALAPDGPAEARSIYAEVMRLLPLVHGLAEARRLGLNARAEELARLVANANYYLALSAR
jgi:hypothetical protein